ncbi:MAG: diguanylate cyclase [bacterium]|nr:diguanylate cyclase [bacterium]MDT8366903.1 diguanylate cyclase [bacterium]
MKHVRSIISGVVWTAVLLIFYRMPIGAQGADWRLPLFLVISWVLGLVLIGWVVFGRQVDPTKGILITVDENTGLANRRAFQGHVEPLLKAAERFIEKSLVVILNINNLDRIIADEGDEVAEEIVIHVAQAFLDSLRGSDILARYDKDELVAFLPKASTVFSDTVTERIMMNVAAQRREMENPKDLNVSIGYAEFDPVAPQSLDYLIRQAYKDMIRSMGETNANAENADDAETQSEPEP